MLNTQKVVVTRAKMCETDLDRVTRIGLILFKRAMGAALSLPELTEFLDGT